jgi:hypothetical protein
MHDKDDDEAQLLTFTMMKVLLLHYVDRTHTPYWLTGQSIDTLEDERFEEYVSLHKEFMDGFE